MPHGTDCAVVVELVFGEDISGGAFGGPGGGILNSPNPSKSPSIACDRLCR